MSGKVASHESLTPAVNAVTNFLSILCDLRMWRSVRRVRRSVRLGDFDNSFLELEHKCHLCSQQGISTTTRPIGPTARGRMNGYGWRWRTSRIGTTTDEDPIHKLVVCGDGGGGLVVDVRTLDYRRKEGGGREEQRQDSKAKSSIGGGSRKSSAVFYAVAARRLFNVMVRTPKLRSCRLRRRRRNQLRPLPPSLGPSSLPCKTDTDRTPNTRRPVRLPVQ